MAHVFESGYIWHQIAISSWFISNGENTTRNQKKTPGSIADFLLSFSWFESSPLATYRVRTTAQTMGKLLEFRDIIQDIILSLTSDL